MSWVTIIWSMNAAVCLTLAGIHLFVWLRARSEWGHLLFSCSAVGAAAVAACELLLMHTETVEQYGAVMRWAQAPLWILLVSVVWFTRIQLRAGRPWLAWAAVMMRTLVLVLTFVTTPNINFESYTGLHQIWFLGELVSKAEGTIHSWAIVAKLSSALVLAFLINASVEVWRRGGRRREFFLGGSMVFFVTAGAVHSALVERGVVQTPYLISFAFLGTILVMAYELSREVHRAAQLVRELHASEMDLRESEERMTQAAEAANLGVWHYDPARNEIWASDSWRTLFGFTKSERIDYDEFLQRLHVDDREAVDQAVTRALASEGRYEREYRLSLPDGRGRWIASHGKVDVAADGKPLLMRGVSLDITARKQAELEVQQQRSELAHLSRVTMLGELSGSLAHELNQPLTAILSNAQAALRFLAHENADLNEVREILTDIVNEDKRAGEVIRRLRLLLKKGEVQHQPLDINEVVMEVLKLVHSDLVNQGVTMHTELAPELPVLQGDRVQLQQVLLNLVMNACDAMATTARDDRQIILRTAVSEDSAVCVSVADCGEGIAPDKLDQVFEPFFTSKSHGMGLGLAVCRTIITAHGGRLWASNTPERGATFHFTLTFANRASS
jgi:two-component system, LuxR family, sensor kinase FixL